MLLNRGYSLVLDAACAFSLGLTAIILFRPKCNYRMFILLLASLAPFSVQWVPLFLWHINRNLAEWALLTIPWIGRIFIPFVLILAAAFPLFLKRRRRVSLALAASLLPFAAATWFHMPIITSAPIHNSLVGQISFQFRDYLTWFVFPAIGTASLGASLGFMFAQGSGKMLSNLWQRHAGWNWTLLGAAIGTATALICFYLFRRLLLMNIFYPITFGFSLLTVWVSAIMFIAWFGERNNIGTLKEPPN